MADLPTAIPWQNMRRWLLEGQGQPVDGPYERAQHARDHTRPWWQVVCLTGVDYFSSLGYAPGIAFVAAGVVSPIATVVLVLLTLLGALPVYLRVAAESPHGSGSIAMLERLLHRWVGKLFVLVLLGFAATDFMITITLSAADAAAHFVQNPLAARLLSGQNVAVTLVLVALLGAVFLRGFREAIGVATALVALYLSLNAVVVVRGAAALLAQPEVWGHWRDALMQSHGSPLGIAVVALLVFPKLALGMSGFETGVAVMPLVKGAPSDSEDRPAGRIRNTRKLLVSAAVIMSLFLICTSIITTLLIPAAAFQPGGVADGRALAYIAHRYLGNAFGTAYDLSTILILWFAGASAMAGLLNLVPRYLPRYGMAPEWARANRPLVLLFTAVGFLITLVFRANVDAQGGAYATGVLVLMTSAAFAVTLSTLRQRQRAFALAFGLITAVLAYTLITNVIERPDGVKIGALFILAIVLVGLWSRLARSTELRADTITADPEARQVLEDQLRRGELRFIANHRDAGDTDEYSEKEREVRAETHLPAADEAVFLEVQVTDPSDFSGVLKVHGLQVGPYRVLRLESPSVPNAIAAFLLWVRDRYGRVPHVYFEWTESGPVDAALDFVLFGEGDVAPLTHEVLRQAEPDELRRPVVHVGG